MFTQNSQKNYIQQVNSLKINVSTKVLIFDDEIELPKIKILLQQLDSVNIEYYITSCEIEFKKLLRSIQPQIILSELQVNDFSAMQLLKYCRMFFPEIPFVFLTNQSYCISTLKLLEDGATDFLFKNKIEDLPNVVFKALRQSREKCEIKATKQKRWEDAQRFKGLIEYSHDPVITYSESGIIKYASPAIERVLGYQVQEFVGTNVLQHIHPDDINLRQQKFEELKLGGVTFTEIEQERLIHKNGSHVWVKAIVSDARLLPGIEGYMTNFRDISETVAGKLKLEKTLKNLTDYKVALDESSIVGIADLKGRITYVNLELIYRSKYQRLELIGKSFKIFQSDEHSDFYYLKIWNDISNGKIWKGELKLKAKDNSHFWVSATVVPFFDETNKPNQYIVVMRDITLRKQKTLELHNSIDLLTSQNKRLLNFSYIVSHNLRSHTSNIQNLISHIEDATDETEKIEMMRYLKNVAEALNETMSNLNEVVSIQSNSELKIETIKLKPFVEKTLLLLKNQILDSNTSIVTEIPEDVEINFSISYLESILQNLILNSIKYKHPHRDPFIKIYCTCESNFVTMNISDNGIGIDIRKFKDKIFGMYKTFHTNKDSKGLGLFMSKNQMEALGGKIEVESVVGDGTTFKLYFK